MKSNGQILYEHKHPAKIRVIPVSKRAFATADDVLLVDNPVFQVPWQFLTVDCKQSWEVTAKGHNLFSPEAT